MSRHTTDAHFVLVADGFELEAATKNAMVSGASLSFSAFASGLFSLYLAIFAIAINERN